MLTSFPTPYPDELFYSVLCRYFISSGIKEFNLIKHQLFQGIKSARMGFLYPSSSIRLVLSQIPKGAFDPKKLIVEHTPFLYFTRMSSEQVKKERLTDILDGYVKKPAHIYTAVPRDGYSLRYCPLCVKEDTKLFGEPYYHVEHQIPLSTVCVKHRCHLKQIEIHNPRISLNDKFWPLSQSELDEEPEGCDQKSVLQVNRLIREYWKLPFSIGPTEGYNNLVQTLLNRDYMIMQPKTGPAVNKAKLYDRLCEYHGSEVVRKHFGVKMPNDAIVRIKQWKQLLPDRYILIQAMLGIDTKTVFDGAPVEDSLFNRIRELERRGGFTTLKRVAQELGMKPYEVKNAFQHYNLEPIWHAIPTKKESVAKNASFSCRVPEDELQKIRAYAQQLGYRGEGPFALDCVRYVMEQRKTGEKGP